MPNMLERGQRGQRGERGEGAGECMAAMKKLCGECEKAEGRECFEKCKAGHEAELSSVCKREGKRLLPGMIQRGKGSEQGEGKGRIVSECAVVLKMLCPLCDAASQAPVVAGRRSTECWAQCRAEHASELSRVCGRAERTVEGSERLEAAEPSSMRMTRSEPVEAAEEGAARVLAASGMLEAAHAETAEAAQDESSEGGSLAGIIGAACAACALVAVVVGVVILRRRQQKPAAEQATIAAAV